ncbi:hypothetical protein TWF696_005666 [Orbilia brochopaga]|uniref:Uncharacterized protein n=1 Tax=Orbilia brochopaga TaxID=3140254 RepID=A0AAV9V4G7_9PEZI
MIVNKRLLFSILLVTFFRPKEGNGLVCKPALHTSLPKVCDNAQQGRWQPIASLEKTDETKEAPKIEVRTLKRLGGTRPKKAQKVPGRGDPRKADKDYKKSIMDQIEDMGPSFADLANRVQDPAAADKDFNPEAEATRRLGEPTFLDEFGNPADGKDGNLFETALKRARKQLKGLQGSDPYAIARDIELHQSANFGKHPLSDTLKALQLSDTSKALQLSEPSFDPDSASFRRVEIWLKNERRRAFQGLVSATQQHLVVGRLTENEWNQDNLIHYMFHSWRSVDSNSGTDASYDSDHLPFSPTTPLRYITLWNIMDKRTLDILYRAAEIPGRRLKNFIDPAQKKQRAAYFFNTDILRLWTKGSLERDGVDALMGLKEVNTVQRMLEIYAQNLHQVAIRAIYIVLDYDSNIPSAEILIELKPSPDEVATDHPPDIVQELNSLDDWGTIFDSLLVVQVSDSTSWPHPFLDKLESIGRWLFGIEADENLFNREDTYFDAKISYLVNPKDHLKRIKTWITYSAVDAHLVIQFGRFRNNHFDEVVEGELLVHALARMLISAWIHLAGHLPIETITFANVASDLGAFIERKTASAPDNVLSFYKENGDDGFQSIIEELWSLKFWQLGFFERFTIWLVSNFGAGQLVGLSLVQMHEYQEFGNCIVFRMKYDTAFNPWAETGADGFYSERVALRRGTLIKANMETLELTYLQDVARIDERLTSAEFIASERNKDIAVDAVLACNEIQQFKEFKDPGLDLANPRYAPTWNDQSGFLDQIRTWAGSLDAEDDEFQSYWRKRVSADFQTGKQMHQAFKFSVNPEQGGSDLDHVMQEADRSDLDHERQLLLTPIIGGYVGLRFFVLPIKQ